LFMVVESIRQLTYMHRTILHDRRATIIYELMQSFLSSESLILLPHISTPHRSSSGISRTAPIIRLLNAVFLFVVKTNMKIAVQTLKICRKRKNVVRRVVFWVSHCEAINEAATISPK
jgi:hypothetical protein